MCHYVYLIHNIINNKAYIGKASDIPKRWAKHITIAFCKREKEKFYIHRAIKKYGVDSFVISEVQKFNDEKECDEAEVYWIKFFNSRNKDFGYNLTDGGEGCLGRKVSEKTRKKMIEKATGRKHTEETKEKLRKINTGKRLSPEAREKASQANLGKIISQEQRIKISRATKGKKKQLLTKEQVIEIRRLYEEENWSQAQIARFFNIKQRNVSFVATYRTWKDLNWKDNIVGENHPHAKLTTEDVISIRKKYKSGKHSSLELAKIYKICKGTVMDIIKRKKWKHV